MCLKKNLLPTLVPTILRKNLNLLDKRRQWRVEIHSRKEVPLLTGLFLLLYVTFTRQKERSWCIINKPILYFSAGRPERKKTFPYGSFALGFFPASLQHRGAFIHLSGFPWLFSDVSQTSFEGKVQILLVQPTGKPFCCPRCPRQMILLPHPTHTHHRESSCCTHWGGAVACHGITSQQVDWRQKGPCLLVCP